MKSLLCSLPFQQAWGQHSTGQQCSENEQQSVPPARTLAMVRHEYISEYSSVLDDPTGSQASRQCRSSLGAPSLILMMSAHWLMIVLCEAQYLCNPNLAAQRTPACPLTSTEENVKLQLHSHNLPRRPPKLGLHQTNVCRPEFGSAMPAFPHQLVAVEVYCMMMGVRGSQAALLLLWRMCWMGIILLGLRTTQHLCSEKVNVGFSCR